MKAILGILIFDAGFISGILWLCLMIDSGHSSYYGRKDGYLQRGWIPRHRKDS